MPEVADCHMVNWPGRPAALMQAADWPALAHGFSGALTYVSAVGSKPVSQGSWKGATSDSSNCQLQWSVASTAVDGIELGSRRL